jgi:hypothetical protein
MYYLFRTPYFFKTDDDCDRNVIIVFQAKTKKHLIKIILNDDNLLRNMNVILFKRFENGEKDLLCGIDPDNKERYLFLNLYKRFGNDLENKLHIDYQVQSEEKVLEVLNILNSFLDKHELKIIKCLFPLFLQYSNQKEINPVIYDFVNHPLFDRNVLGLISEY